MAAPLGAAGLGALGAFLAWAAAEILAAIGVGTVARPRTAVAQGDCHRADRERFSLGAKRTPADQVRMG